MERMGRENLRGESGRPELGETAANWLLALSIWQLAFRHQLSAQPSLLVIRTERFSPVWRDLRLVLGLLREAIGMYSFLTIGRVSGFRQIPGETGEQPKHPLPNIPVKS
jgi:hypothetical protein